MADLRGVRDFRVNHHGEVNLQFSHLHRSRGGLVDAEIVGFDGAEVAVGKASPSILTNLVFP